MKINNFFLLFISVFFISFMYGCAGEAGTLQAEVTETPYITAEPEAPEETLPPENITIEISTTSEDYKNDDGEILLSYNAASANVMIRDDIAATDAINASLTSGYGAFSAQLNDYVLMASEDYKYRSSEVSFYWNSYTLTRDISVERSDPGVISLLNIDSFYLGGAHGGSSISAENYDVKTGKFITLDDLSWDKQALEDYVIPYLLWLTQKQGFGDGLTWADEEIFKTIFVDGSWYLSETGLGVICNEYTIGPYVLGTIYLEVPYEDLSGILLDKWMPAEGK